MTPRHSASGAARSQRIHGVRRIDLSTFSSRQARMRDINCDILLEIIRLRQPLSRVELARYSGMQPSTISVIVEQLLGEGWIRAPRHRLPFARTPFNHARRFRPPRHLRTRHPPGRAILPAIDLTGRFLSREIIMTVSDAAGSMKRTVERLKVLRQLIATNALRASVSASLHSRVQS